MDKTIILNKIKSYYGFKKDAELAKLLGISPQTLSNWKARNTYDPELIYSKCVEINPDWLLSGKGPVGKKEYSANESQLPTLEDPDYKIATEKSKNIPLYDLEAEESLKNIFEENSTTPISSFIKIPNLDKCDGGLYVKGDSMLPLLKSGDIALFKNITTENIFWGEMYLMEISLENENNLVFIRYLHKSEKGEDFVKIVSENPIYESTDLPINKINFLALIRASIRFH